MVRAQTALRRTEADLAEREAQRKADAAEAKESVEAERRRRLSEQALALVERNASSVLNYAYPLAFGHLAYRNAEAVGVGSDGGAYVATVRMNYINLLGQPHYLEIAFRYDDTGGYREWRIVRHSDVVTPRELTLGTLFDLSKQ